MKYIFYLFVATVLVVILLLSLLFTPVGNRVLQPIVENKINSHLPFELKLEKFRLNTKDFELLLRLSEESSIHLKAKYNLMSQSIDGKYELLLLDLSQLSELVDYPLQGALQTQGDVKGNYDFLHLRGLLALADGGGEYSVDIYALEPKNFISDLRGINIDKLLTMANLPIYARGNLFVQTDLNFSTLPKGSVKLFVEDGKLNQTLLKEEFDIDMPPSDFNADIQLNLADEIKVDALVDSQLLKIKIDGTSKEEKIDAKYEIDIKYLEALEPLIGGRFNGPLKVSGNILGSKEKVVSKIVSDFAGGVSRYIVALDQLALQNVEGKSEKINLKSLFEVLNLPLFASGYADVELSLQNLDSTKRGNIMLISEGRVNNNYLHKEFEKKLIHNQFSLLFGADIDGDLLLGEAMLEMDIATLQLQNIDFNFDNFALQSEFGLHVSQLQKLKGLIEKELEGEVEFVGNFKYHKDDTDDFLKVEAQSSSVGGEVFIALDNTLLQVDADDVLMEKLLKMAKLPIVLKGEAVADLEYDIESQTGILKADFIASQFAKSFLTDAIMQYGKVDLRNKKFQRADLVSRISGENIVSEFIFQMPDIILSSEQLQINRFTNTIKGDVSLILKNQRYNIKINGSLDNLQDAFDYEDLLRQEVQRQIERKAKEFIEKELGEDLFQKFRGLF